MKKAIKTGQYGFTSISKKGTRFYIEHNGNMGNSLNDVSSNVKKITGFSLQCLKDTNQVVKETGSPDYNYQLILRSKIAEK